MTRMKTSGPFFNNPSARLVKAGNRALTDIARLGMEDVRSQLKPGHGFKEGNLFKHVLGYLHPTKNLHAVIDAGEKLLGANLIYSYWVEGVSTLNKRSRFKGYRMFRRTARWLNKKPKAVDDLFERAIREEFS